MRPLEAVAPVEEVEPEERAHAPADRRVVLRISRVGWHSFSSIAVVEGAWHARLDPDPSGTETVSALGRTFEGCSIDGDVTVCPEVGVLQRSTRKRGWHQDERVIALRRGGVTWAESPCDVMHFVSDRVREASCEHSIRTLGAGPSPGLRPGDASCRWRYRAEGPGSSDAIVEARLASAAGEIESWARADADATLVEHPRHRTWIVRSPEWTAAVRVDRRACGDADGVGLARELMELAPR